MLKVMARPVDGIGREDLWRGELSLEMESLHSVQELLKTIEARLDEFVISDTRCGLVQTIPGVGPRLAEIVVAILDDPHRFKNRKQVASYVGLSPRIYQSGNSDRQGRISGQGNSLLRMMLVEIA
jgi:transposase